MSYLAGIARHNEVLAVFVSDPVERELPPPGRYRIVSNEDEMTIDTYARAARDEYRHEFEHRHTVFDKFCQRYGVHLMNLSTDQDPVEAMQKALGRRAH